MQTPNSNEGGDTTASSDGKKTNMATTTTITTSSFHKPNTGSFDVRHQHKQQFDYSSRSSSKLDPDTDTSTNDDRSCSASKIDKIGTKIKRLTKEELKLLKKMIESMTTPPLIHWAMIESYYAILPHCTHESVSNFLDELGQVFDGNQRDHLVSQLTVENGLLRFDEQSDGKVVVPSKCVKLETGVARQIKRMGNNLIWKIRAIGMSKKATWNHVLTKFKKYLTELDIIYFHPGHPRAGDTVSIDLREALAEIVLPIETVQGALHSNRRSFLLAIADSWLNGTYGLTESSSHS